MYVYVGQQLWPHNTLLSKSQFSGSIGKQYQDFIACVAFIILSNYIMILADFTSICISTELQW